MTTTTATDADRILEFVCLYKSHEDGNSPALAAIAVHTGLDVPAVRAGLRQLEQDGKIETFGPVIIVKGGRWFRPGARLAPSDNIAIHNWKMKAARLEAENAALRAERDELRRERDHFEHASTAHLAELERQRWRIADLRAELAELKRSLKNNDPLADKLKDKRIGALEAENIRLRADLAAAADAWLVYERQARQHRELYALGRYAALRIAGLTADLARLRPAGHKEPAEPFLPMPGALAADLFWQARARKLATTGSEGPDLAGRQKRADLSDLSERM